jgi:chromosome segregation ATPase
LSTSKELETLKSRRTKFEEESRSLTEKQKNLEERIKVLEENIAIEKLKNSNKATSEVISQLESKIKGLEQKLEEVSRAPETPIHAFEIKPEVATAPEPEQVKPETVEPTPEEATEEETVTVMPFEEPMVAGQEEYGEDLKKQLEKKKRRFF